MGAHKGIGSAQVPASVVRRKGAGARKATAGVLVIYSAQAKAILESLLVRSTTVVNNLLSTRLAVAGKTM
jgi:hypothetical protein